MTAITMDNFKKNVNAYVEMAVAKTSPVTLTTNKGNAVLVSEEEYNGLLETLHLLNAAGMKERIEEARLTPIKESEDFEW